MVGSESLGSLASLGEGECFVSYDPGEEAFGVLHVGESISHQLKQRQKQNFLLGFGIDPELLKLTQEPNHLAAIVKSFILVEQDPHHMESQNEGLQLNDCKVVPVGSTCCVANNRVYPVQSLQRARDILGRYTTSCDIERQQLPFVVAVQADPCEDEQDVRYLGKGISGPSKLLTVLVRDVKSASYFDQETNIQSRGRKVGVKGTYDIWGSSADENSRGSLVLYWDCESSMVSAPLQAPSHTGPIKSYFLLKGSSDSEQIQEVQDFDRKLGVLVELYNCSTGAVDLSNDKKLVSRIDSADWDGFVKAFIDSSGAVTRSQQQRHGDDVSIQKIIRTDRDFTEAFWETVVCDPNATPLQVLRAVRDMSLALHQGTLLPLVSKTNNTFFGEYCRRAIAMEKQRNSEDKTAGLKPEKGMSEQEFRLVGETLENISSDKTKQLVASKLVELGCFVLGAALENRISYHASTSCLETTSQTRTSSPLDQLRRLISLRDTLQLCTTATVLNCPGEILSPILKRSLETSQQKDKQNLSIRGGRVAVNPDRSFPYCVVAVEPSSSWLQDCCKVLPRPVYWRYTCQNGAKLDQFACVQPGTAESLHCTTRLDTNHLKRMMDKVLDLLSKNQTFQNTDIPWYAMRKTKISSPVGDGLEGFEVYKTEVVHLNLQN